MEEKEKEIQTETPAEETVETTDAKAEKKCKKANKQVDTLKEKIAELEKQVAERDDMLLRKAAEFDNYKRRENQNKEKLTML